MARNNYTRIPGELYSDDKDHIVAGAEHIKDYQRGKTQEEVNTELLEQAAQIGDAVAGLPVKFDVYNASAGDVIPDGALLTWAGAPVETRIAEVSEVKTLMVACARVKENNTDWPNPKQVRLLTFVLGHSLVATSAANGAKPFNGFQDEDITVAQTGYNGTPQEIYFNTVKGCFIGKTGNAIQGYTYYNSWSNDADYRSNAASNVFVYANGQVASYYRYVENGGYVMGNITNFSQLSADLKEVWGGAQVDISGKANKSEMSITAGTGINADKTTITLKEGTSATVLTQHQDISGKVDVVDGKGLSTNDYTNEEKQAVATIGNKANTSDVYPKTNTYNKSEVDNKVDVAVAGAAFLGEEEGEASVADFDPRTDTLWKKEQLLTDTEKAAVKSNLGITQDLAQMRSEIDMQNAAVAQLDGHALVIVDTLPTDASPAETPDPDVIYRKYADDGQGNVSYEDYMYNSADLTTPIKIATYALPGIDDKPTAGSDNLVKSGGVYNSNNLFTHPIANRVIKELYIPGVDYTSVYKLQLCIAALHEGRYYNRIWLFYTLDGTSKQIVIYSKTFDTESEALEDISNMQGLRHSLGSDYYAIISADASMAGTILWDVAISVNKDFADLNNSPILKGYIDSLDRFKGERVLYIKSNGTLSVPSGVSRIFTTYVIAGKKYKIVSEAEDNNNRCVSFTSDFDGYAAIPHDVGGTNNVRSFYHIGTNVYTAPAGAKYMHITTQFQGDTNSLPYVSIREYESDLADIHADIQSDLADLADIQADIQADLADIQTDLAGDSEKYYYTDDTIPGSLYESFGAELGTTFVQASYNLEGWYCLKLNVHKGEQIQVCASTKISTRQRPYVLTNLQNKVIRTSPVGGDFTTADTFTAESDGYLYVNNNSARLPMSNFFVKVAIHGLTLDKLREISIQSQEIVSDLASRIIPDDNNPLAVVKQTPGLTSILHRIGVVGASFTNGGHDRTDGIFGVEAGREFSWPQRLARLCGITCFNFGQSGYWCKYWLDNNGGYYDAVAEPENKCDAYIISFASNDKPSKSGYDLGTIDDVHVGNESENGASYYGYFSQVIARCHEVQQRAYLFVLTYPAGYDITESGGYTQAMRDVVDVYKAAGYKIYLIDYASYGMSTAEATAKNLKRGTHYVAAGYQYMTYEICTYIDWIIRQNIKDFEDAAFVRTTAEYVPTGGTPVGYDKNDFFVGPEHNKYLNIDYRRPRFYYTKAEVDALIAELRAELVTNQ